MRTKYPLLWLLWIGSVMASVTLAETNVQKNGPQSYDTLRIAFTSKRDGNFDIFSMRADGSDLSKLTYSKNEDIKPMWSPDGTRIMYLSKNRTTTAIMVMNSDGSGGKKIVSDCVGEYLPAWSPDGSKILFVAEAQSRKAIFTINADGSQLVRLSSAGVEGNSPVWAPDGSRVLYLERYQNDTFIYSIRPDGTDRRRVTREKGPYQGAVWSPDGTKIAYILPQRKLPGTYNRIYIMDSDGSQPVEIAEGSRRVESIEYPDQICWSPDGTAIVFTKVTHVDAHVSEKGTPRFFYEYGVSMADVAGNDHSRVLVKTGAERAQPVWSPDGSKVAVLYQSRLLIYHLKTGLDQEIRVNVALPLSPLRWSPGGDQLIVAGKNSSFQKSGLYRISLDGEIAVLSVANDYDPVWSPVLREL